MTPFKTTCSMLAGWKSAGHQVWQHPDVDILPIPAFSHYAGQTSLDALYDPSVVLPHSSDWR